MDFNNFANMPSNEFELFMKLAQSILMDFDRVHGENIYFHLRDIGNRKHSEIDEIKKFTDLYEFGHFAYIERDRHACIFLRSDEDSIAMLLHGERDAGQLIIKKDSILILYGPEESTLPGERRCKLTAIEMMEAFGFIADSLQESKGSKVS